MALRRLRTQLWHLRTGGLPQLRAHNARMRAQDHTPSAEVRSSQGVIAVDPWPVPKQTPRRDLRVGVILDAFSALALGYEWDQVPIPRQDPASFLEANPIDLLFVESAWHGNDHAWQYALTGPSAPAPELRELLTWCAQNNVPTVFWNKEDPIHFEEFSATAELFNHVFTTDSNKLESYRELLSHDRVGVMPFAAQEQVHNPVRPAKGYHGRDVCFAGMYFAHRHPERREQMDLLLSAAAQVSPRMDRGLEIFSRYLGDDEKYQFPGELADRVVGSLDYEQMLAAYRMYKVFLNVNTIVDSPTMCARRIFEITASGTPVVSTPSPAIDSFFDESMVTQVHTQEEAGYAIRALVNSPELRTAQVHRAQREIWQGHTYNHRVNDVLTQVGLTEHVMPTTPSVSMLVSTNRPGQIDHVLETAFRQQGVKHQLVLLTHGFDLEQDVLARAREAGLEDVVLLTAESSVPLGACLNMLAAAADGEFAAKIDDDDVYGEHYLADQAHAMAYSGADVVGKQAHYVHLHASGATALHSPEREHRFTDFIPGPTIFSRTATIRELGFPELRRGEDTGFLERVRAAEGKIYSADRFQFIRTRLAPAADGSQAHTWATPDWHILANSRVTYFGSDPAPVMI